MIGHTPWAYQNAWANHRLLRACAQLTPAEFAAPRTSFFPSLVATLNHILTVDWFYLDAFERALAGKPHNPTPRTFFEPEVPLPDCAALAAAQRAADRRLIAVARAIDGRSSAAAGSTPEWECGGIDSGRHALPVPILRATGVQSETASRLLAHVLEHDIHHRGQAHAMLADTRIAPPQLDEFFLANEAHLRAADLAELGFTEAEIWS